MWTRRLGQLAMVLIVCALAGVAVVVLPFRSEGKADMAPLGPACWFEQDPGSGRSWLGAERVIGGIAPYRVCDPIGPLSTPTSGPGFEAAVADPQLPPLAGGYLDRALTGNRTGPPWEPTSWPWVAAVVAGGFAVAACAVWVVALLFRRFSRGATRDVASP